VAELEAVRDLVQRWAAQNAPDAVVVVRQDHGGGRAPAQRVHTGGDSLPHHPPTPGSDRRRPQAKTKKTADRAVADEARQDKRHGRWTLRHNIQQVTELKALRNCGYGTIPGKDVQLTVRPTEEGNRAGFDNVLRCGSVWSCPQCAATIANGRAQQVRQIMKTALEQDFSAAFATFTMRHRKHHKLRDLWSALSHGWARATGGNPWINDRAAGGIVGFVRVVEVTYSKKNGWHVHVHVLLVFNAQVTVEHARRYSHRMWDRWASGLRKHGYTCDRDKGHDVRMAKLKFSEDNEFEQYFTKMAHEITSGYAKAAIGLSLAPFQIAALATNPVLPKAYADEWLPVWKEWELGSKSRKQMLISKELREWANVPEVDDVELAKDDNGDAIEAVSIVLPYFTWEALRGSPTLACSLLNAAENGGMPAAIAWLERRGYRWYEPDPPPPKVDEREQLLAAVASFGW
jgi:hypothetical protein